MRRDFGKLRSSFPWKFEAEIYYILVFMYIFENYEADLVDLFKPCIDKK